VAVGASFADQLVEVIAPDRQKFGLIFELCAERLIPLSGEPAAGLWLVIRKQLSEALAQAFIKAFALH
jgi:hypothetical protein